MKKITITTKYMDGKWDVVDKINAKLLDFGIEIVLKEYTEPQPYNYNRSYMTNERARDVRLDRASSLRISAAQN